MQPVAVHVRLHLDRHEVLHLPHAVGREEARDEDVRVREVELLRRPLVARRAQGVVAAAVLVEDRPEHARRVERGQQYQSMVPFVPTSATVWRSPTKPVLGDGEVLALVLARRWPPG